MWGDKKPLLGTPPPPAPIPWPTRLRGTFRRPVGSRGRPRLSAWCSRLSAGTKPAIVAGTVVEDLIMILLRRSLMRHARVPDTSLLAAVQRALQQAIELEHSTIPPICVPLLTGPRPERRSGRNHPIGRHRRDAAPHAGRQCTQCPGRIAHPRRRALHPDLPGAVAGIGRGGLVVPLAPCSPYLISGVFMSIEQPRHELDFPGGEAELLARTRSRSERSTKRSRPRSAAWTPVTSPAVPRGKSDRHECATPFG